jgi:hypothetical protein
MKNSIAKRILTFALVLMMLVAASGVYAVSASADNTAIDASVLDAYATNQFALGMTAVASQEDSSIINVQITVRNIQQQLDGVEFKLNFNKSQVSGVITNSESDMDSFMTVSPMYTLSLTGTEISVSRYEQICYYDAANGAYECRFVDLLDYPSAKAGQVYNGLINDGDLVITIPFKILKPSANTQYTFSVSDVYGTTRNGYELVTGTGASTVYTSPNAPAPASTFLAGTMNNWSTSDTPLTGSGETVSTTMTLNAGTYYFKMYSNGGWYGNSGTIYDTTTATSAIGWEMSSNAPDCTLVASGGTYTFTFNPTTKFLVITHAGNQTTNITVTPKTMTLSLEDEVLYNLYYTVEGMDVNTNNLGILIFNNEPTSVSVANADTVVEGAVYDAAKGRYMSSTPGIPGKNLADTIYLVAYAKAPNGSYVYGRTVSYSAHKYCTGKMTSTDNNLRAVCVALMNYGAAAQEYFAATTDYTYTTPMNKDFASYQNLVKAYNSSMLASRLDVNAAKAGTLGIDKNGFSKRSVSMSADGDFSLNYYFTTSQAVDKVTFYYWTQDQYNSVGTLTLKNASGSKEMELTDGTNRYWANLSGIAAKDVDKTIFACGVYVKNGVTYSTGVFSYSIGYYCTTKAASNDAVLQPLAKAIAVYSYYAKIFLNQ